MIGDTSAASTATMASSSNATPSAVSPSRSRAWPRPARGSVARSRSPKRSPILAACPKVAYAAAASPSAKRCSASGRSRYPCSTQSSWPSSSSRRARASQPPARASSPRFSRPKASQNAHRAAAHQRRGRGTPAAGAGQLAPVQQAEGQPERAPGGTLGAAQPQPPPMGARQDLVALGIPTHQVGGLGQQLQILRGKGGLPVGRRQLVEGIRPRLPLQGGPAPIQRVSRGHAPPPPADTPTQVARRTSAPYRLPLTGSGVQ